MFKKSIYQFNKANDSNLITYPIFFGTYDFEGLQSILSLLIQFECDTLPIIQFSDYVSNFVTFVDVN